MDVLLTNDDGIDAVGLRALHDALGEDHAVTVVAPADDQSAVGRKLSHEVELTEHPLGYAVEGTPTDCVVAAQGALDLEFDIVVAGCNYGANLGEYVLGRSGTVSAAVEAAFYGIPAIAASVYFPLGDINFTDYEPDPVDFAEAASAVDHLVDHALNVGVFDHADYLNVNAPRPQEARDAPMEITRPSHVYDMDAVWNEGTVRIRDRIWERMSEGDVPDPQGSDRRAVVEGRVSVSPLTVPHTTNHHEALDGLAETYDP